MSEQMWNLKANIVANFFIVNDDKISSQAKPPHPSIRRFSIIPEFDENNHQTGKFIIDIDFVADSNEDTTVNVGKDILQYFLNLLTFLSGYPIKLSSPPTFNFQIPNSKINRQIYISTDVHFFEPPVPLNRITLLTTHLDPIHVKIISWLRRGIDENDVVNSIYSLFIALELLSCQFSCDEKVIRKCIKCGFESELDPGMRQKVKSFLVNHMDYPIDKYDKFWKTRNKLSHGGLNLSSDEISDLKNIKEELSFVIVRGVKKLLNLSSNEPPRETSLKLFHDEVLLSIDWVEKTE